MCLLSIEEHEKEKIRHNNDGVRNSANKQPKRVFYRFYPYTSFVIPINDTRPSL
jgi:hypothetical protein